ncbi:MAG: hypothetical protein ACLFV7_03590 [Phycisphaerae bacterium]
MNEILQWLVGVEAGDLAKGGQWRLGFIAEYNNYITLALWAALIGLIALTVRSYRREGEAPSRAKGVLAGLRIAVIVLVFCIAFRPAVVWKFTKTLYSAVVLVIDDSKSMSFTDKYGDDPNQKAALASLTGLEDPEAVRTMTRSEIVRAILRRPDGPLAKLAEDHPLVMLHFSTTQAGKESYTRSLGNEINVVAEEGDHDARKLAESLRETLDGLQADGFETNLSAALRDAVERTRGRRLAGMVFIGDGQNTTRDAASRMPGALVHADRVGPPRYAVLVGDTTEPRNTAITALRAPREVRQKSRVEVTAILSHRNMGGKTVTLELYRRKEGEPRDKREKVATETVLLEADTAENGRKSDRGVQSKTLHIEPDVEGSFLYTAVVNSGVEERNTRDNEADAVIEVSDSKIRILLVSGYAGWEFQYLRNYLLRSPQLYRVSVWQQNADAEINQSSSALEMRLDKLPSSLKELMGSTDPEEQDKYPGYDIVILNDPRPEAEGFDPNFVGMLKTFVADHNGGLCYIAGGKWADKVLGDVSFKPLADLLPVYVGKSISEWKERIHGKKPEDWPLKITDYGWEHPVMRLGASVEESRDLWDVMPGIYWSKSVFDIKPAERVLAENSDPTHRTSTNEPEPVVAVQPVGGGRVLYLGFQATWRWRYLNEAEYYRQFWGNVVRYLATLKARHIVITTGGDRFSAGERMTVEVEAHDENYNKLVTEDGTFTVDMVDTRSGEVRKLTLQAVENQPGQYKAEVLVDKTGTYELTAMRDDPQAAEKVAGKRINVELPRAEAARTEANANNMLTLASKDQNFMTIAEVDKLATMIPAGKMNVVDEVPRELWDSPLMLILVVSLLVAEWILRKKYNMA